jgi:hypothetical protein
MRPALTSSFWTWLPFALAVLFIGWSVWLMVAVQRKRGELTAHLGLTSKLLRLETAARDLDRTGTSATGQDWKAFHAIFAQELSAVRAHGGLGDVEPLLGRAEDAVGRLESLQAASQAAEFRGCLLGVLHDLGVAVRAARERSSGISVDLAAKWQQLNALAVIACLLAIGVALALRLAGRQILERQQAEASLLDLKCALANRVRELEQAMAEVKQLRGLIPICAYCKSIRDDQNYWQRLEDYVTAHTDATFTHGICPECLKRVFGEMKA